MAVYTEQKTYHTRANMGMIDVTEDFQHAVTEACRQKGISDGVITGFTTGGVAGLTTLEFEPGIVNHDLKAALDVFSPYLDERGRVVPYWHHETWHDDNGSSHIKAALLSPFITVPFVNGKITVGPWQNLTLIECDTRDRVRDIAFQVVGGGRRPVPPGGRRTRVPAEPGPWSGRALPDRSGKMRGPRPPPAAGACDTRDRVRDIVFQVMGE